MKSDQFPEISDLLASYFHQEWHEEFQTYQNVLKEMLKGESRERLVVACAEIDEILGVGLNSEKLQKFAINELGCYFEPASIGLSWAEWLRQIKGTFGVL